MVKKLLTLLLIVIGIFLSTPANAETHSKVTVKEAIVKHSIELGIDPALGLSIAKLESGFCHEKKSVHGAVGVFQLMPNTARALGYNPWQMQDNVRGGLTYYNMLYKKFGSVELALAAYNAGPGNVMKYKGIPPFGETKKFVSNIMNEYNYQKSNPDPAIVKAKKNKATLKKAVTSENKPITKIPEEVPRIEKDVELEQAIQDIAENILI